MKKCCVLLLLAASTDSWAQKDSINKISLGLNLITHGEMCGGGLPRSDSEILIEDRSQFLFGRTRIKVDYERKGLQAHAVIQNLAVWGMSGNQIVNLYEGWVKMTAREGHCSQDGSYRRQGIRVHVWAHSYTWLSCAGSSPSPSSSFSSTLSISYKTILLPHYTIT